jgi:protein gp37
VSTKSKIEWTDATWNPVVGCTKVSEACRNCYAERMAARMACNPLTPQYAGTVENRGEGPCWTGQVNAIQDKLGEPMGWKKPRMVFPCSMSDIFHEQTPDVFIKAMFGVMSFCGQHTFQVLTKRIDRAFEIISHTSLAECQAYAVNLLPKCTGAQIRNDSTINTWPLKNVWFGATIWDQPSADRIIPILLQIPAAVRFVSVEPMLGPVELGCDGPELGWINYLRPPRINGEQMPGIDWVICGGESGPHARPMHPAWVRSLRDQCETAGVPFLFKQWGAWMPSVGEYRDSVWQCGKFIEKPSHDEWQNGLLFKDAFMRRACKKAAGKLLDGQEWHQMPEVRHA